MTREEWLELAITEMKSTIFNRYTIPAVRVSTGFTGSRQGNKSIGSHWAPAASVDGVGQIFISPIIDDSVRVLDILCHELVHAIVGNAEGHGKVFKRVATSIGLTGKMTATVADEKLKSELEILVSCIGKYPHGAINVANGPTKKQGTRMIKCECLSCGYTVRTTKQWLEMGAPICPCSGESMEVKQ